MFLCSVLSSLTPPSFTLSSIWDPSAEDAGDWSRDLLPAKLVGIFLEIASSWYACLNWSLSPTSWSSVILTGPDWRAGGRTGSWTCYEGKGKQVLLQPTKWFGHVVKNDHNTSYYLLQPSALSPFVLLCPSSQQICGVAYIAGCILQMWKFPCPHFTEMEMWTGMSGLRVKSPIGISAPALSPVDWIALACVLVWSNQRQCIPDTKLTWAALRRLHLVFHTSC